MTHDHHSSTVVERDSSRSGPVMAILAIVLVLFLVWAVFLAGGSSTAAHLTAELRGSSGRKNKPTWTLTFLPRQSKTRLSRRRLRDENSFAFVSTEPRHSRLDRTC